MNASQLAKKLGRRGGMARAKKLSAERRREIASRGGLSKALSAKAEQRIHKNFKYLAAVKSLRKLPKPKSSSRVYGTLPGPTNHEK